MLPVAIQLRRTPRLLLGLVLFGIGIALIVLGDYGLPGWDVFHQGLSEKTPISIGTAVILVGAVIVFVLLFLKEPIGLGTIANVIVIGLAMDATLFLVDDPTSTWTRAALTLVGPVVVAIGSGLYLGVRLGPGPRDGLMTALARRGVTSGRHASQWKPWPSPSATSWGAPSGGEPSGSSCQLGRSCRLRCASCRCRTSPTSPGSRGSS